MIFLANRANLDKRTLLTRLHNQLQTQVSDDTAPIEKVWYHTSAGNKVGVRATVDTASFLDESYPVDEAELQVSFDFPADREYDFYTIQWVESTRRLMIGWHQDETHIELGECHLQIDFQDETIQRDKAVFMDNHPLNVFEQRMDDLVVIIDSLSWEDGLPAIPKSVVR